MGKNARKLIVIIASLFFLCEGTLRAQNSFDLRYAKAAQYYENGKYDEAVLILKASLDGVGLTEAQREKASSLMSLCKKAATASNMVTASISSSPSLSKVTIDGTGPQLTPFTINLGQGKHALVVEKEGYFPIDTTIVVSKANSSFSLNLRPRYATVTLNVRPEEGYAFTDGPEAQLGGHSFDLSAKTSEKHADDNIALYQMYEDGVLLVPQGSYILVLSAAGFDSKALELSLSGGEKKEIAVKLLAKKGTISFSGNALSDGAAVILDGVTIGTLPLDKLTVSSGRHTLSYIKEGLKTEAPEHYIDVPDGGAVEEWVRMLPFARYEIACDQAEAGILLDGKEIGKAPFTAEITQGKHKIMALKDGFYCGEIEISVKPEDEPDGRIELSMQPARTIHFSTDRGGKHETLSLYTKDGHVLAESLGLPCDTAVPAGENKFEAIVRTDEPLYRAYKGPVVLNGCIDEYTIRTFSKHYMQWVGAELRLAPATMSSACDVSLLKFSPLPFAGLSTALLKGHLDIGSTPTLSSLSCILLNWDFRVGGSLSKGVDAGIIASFTYYPDMSWAGISGPRGVDWFAGMELGSRTPYVNASLKAGVNFGNLADKVRFEIRLGMTLGGKNSKGNSYLRF